MDFYYFIGIDIAKDTLDWAVYTQDGLQLSAHEGNTNTGIKMVLTQLKTLPNWNAKQAVFCMEHTGIYNVNTPIQIEPPAPVETEPPAPVQTEPPVDK